MHVMLRSRTFTPRLRNPDHRECVCALVQDVQLILNNDKAKRKPSLQRTVHPIITRRKLAVILEIGQHVKKCDGKRVCAVWNVEKAVYRKKWDSNMR